MEINNIEVEYELVEWNIKDNYNKKICNWIKTTYIKACFFIIYFNVFFKNIIGSRIIYRIIKQIKNQIEIKKAIKIINFYMNVDIKKQTRKTKIKEARHIFYYLMHCKGFSKSELSKELKQTHGVVIHAIKTIENDMIFNKKLALNVKLMETYFTNNKIKKHRAKISV